jgi:hypothetical protein
MGSNASRSPSFAIVSSRLGRGPGAASTRYPTKPTAAIRSSEKLAQAHFQYADVAALSRQAANGRLASLHYLAVSLRGSTAPLVEQPGASHGLPVIRVLHLDPRPLIANHAVRANRCERRLGVPPRRRTVSDQPLSALQNPLVLVHLGISDPSELPGE